LNAFGPNVERLRNGVYVRGAHVHCMLGLTLVWRLTNSCALDKQTSSARV
jgi:hypothetical protein